MVIVKDNTEALELDTERFCSCPPKHINCMTAKEWIKSQLGVWQFYYESRDIRDKNAHPATYPISLAARCISLFTHEGELVLDPFVGSGTTLVAAQDLNRNAVGFDLKGEYVELSKSRLADSGREADARQLAICADARDIANYMEPDSVSLIMTSPPYANLLNRPRLNKSRRGVERKNDQYLKTEQYSQDARDLGTLSLDTYQQAMAEIYGGLFPLLKERGHCVIDVPDMWLDNRRIMIHTAVVEALRSVGYELRNTIIWDRTNIVNRVGIFGWPSNYITMGTTFEYLLDFWKPTGGV
jgi:DNA modification methylase